MAERVAVDWSVEEYGLFLPYSESCISPHNQMVLLLENKVGFVKKTDIIKILLIAESDLRLQKLRY